MELTHFDEKGNARMVSVGDKKETVRKASARGRIKVSEEVFKRVSADTVSKGDVLTVATTAGIMGAKNTFSTIPMCHIVQLTGCSVDWECDEEKSEFICTCTAECAGKTGVEMEALTGVSTALLTFYDMCKAIDKKMEIKSVYLLNKSGGKSGDVQNSDSDFE